MAAAAPSSLGQSPVEMVAGHDRRPQDAAVDSPSSPQCVCASGRSTIDLRHTHEHHTHTHTHTHADGKEQKGANTTGPERVDSRPAVGGRGGGGRGVYCPADEGGQARKTRRPSVTQDTSCCWRGEIFLFF